MKKIMRWTSILPALCAATLLAGCGSTGVGDILGSGNDRDTTTNRNDPYEQRLDNVRGTVESVDTRNRTIVVDVEDATYRNDLRNGNDNDEVVLEYDDNTTVEYQGKTYRPEDLERGDRILAEVDESGLSASRMRADEIQVLTDATSGQNTGIYDDDDDDYRTADGDLRGTVRYIDTRNRTLEIETSSRSFSTSTGSSGVVTVYYDAQTVVEFEGRRYQPDNLERGDEVEIDTRTLSGGRLMAEEIQVVGDSRSTR